MISFFHWFSTCLNLVKFLPGYFIKEKTNFGYTNFRCLQCDYSSTNIWNFKRHCLKHTGKRPFSCQKCDYTTNRKDCLKLHILKKHQV